MQSAAKAGSKLGRQGQIEVQGKQALTVRWKLTLSTSCVCITKGLCVQRLQRPLGAC